MPSTSQLNRAAAEYVDAWNTGERDRWLAAWTEQPRVEWPAGSDPVHGRDRLVQGWHDFRTTNPYRLTTLAAIPGVTEVALHLRWTGADGAHERDAITVLTVDDDGLIAADRQFYDVPVEPGSPAERRRTMLARHFEWFSRGHEEPDLFDGWVALFTEDCTLEDPVGSEPRSGLMAEGWAMAHTEARRITGSVGKGRSKGAD